EIPIREHASLTLSPFWTQKASNLPKKSFVVSDFSCTSVLYVRFLLPCSPCGPQLNKPRELRIYEAPTMPFRPRQPRVKPAVRRARKHLWANGWSYRAA